MAAIESHIKYLKILGYTAFAVTAVNAVTGCTVSMPNGGR